MPYMYLVWIALLVPLSGYGGEREARIKELKGAQIQKKLELTELARRITESDNYITSCYFKYSQLLEIAIANKSNLLGGESINDQEFEKMVESQGLVLFKDVHDVLNGATSFDCDLTVALFDQDTFRVDSFDSLKFMFVRMAVERSLLVQLSLRFQTCLQELAAVNNELMAIEQQQVSR